MLPRDTIPVPHSVIVWALRCTDQTIPTDYD
jgi:hypothetical protein